MVPQDKIGPLFKQIYDALEKESNHMLRDNDLTMAQIHLLFTLRERSDGTCTLKELEKNLHVAQSTTVGIVKRSEQKGFVACCGDENDKRIKIVQITAKGIEVCQQAQQNLQKAERKLLAGLTEAEIGIFIELLQRVRKNLC